MGGERGVEVVCAMHVQHTPIMRVVEQQRRRSAEGEHDVERVCAMYAYHTADRRSASTRGGAQWNLNGMRMWFV